MGELTEDKVIHTLSVLKRLKATVSSSIQIIQDNELMIFKDLEKLQDSEKSIEFMLATYSFLKSDIEKRNRRHPKLKKGKHKCD